MFIILIEFTKSISLTARLGEGHVKYSIPTGPPVGKHCEFCSNPHHIGGPIWIDKMHNSQFVSDLLQ